MIGKYVRLRPDIARAVQMAGHVIGNHTDQHPSLSACDSEDVTAELQRCQAAIEDATGKRPRVFRPPFGHSSDVVDRTAKELGLTGVIWSVIPEDWNATSGGLIVGRVRAVIDSRKQGEIVLLHDGDHSKFDGNRHHTVSATRKLLAHYSEAGKRFVSVLEISSYWKLEH